MLGQSQKGLKCPEKSRNVEMKSIRGGGKVEVSAKVGMLREVNRTRNI